MSRSIYAAYNALKRELEKICEQDYVFEAKQIIKHVTGYTNREILEKYLDPLTPAQENALTAIMEQRKMRYPLQYIFGTWDFYGLPFKVGPGVLIPRADTEILVEKSLELIKDKKEPRVADLCTGSGCIAVAIAKSRPDAAVTAVEKYDAAIGYAIRNIAANGTGNVTAVQGDVLLGAAAEKKYDLIVSNPPYITAAEMKTLQPEVTYEPKTALDGGADGLDFYRAIIEKYKNSFAKGGAIAFETSDQSAQSVAGLLSGAGFENVGIAKDFEERQRVVFGTAVNI